MLEKEKIYDSSQNKLKHLHDNYDESILELKEEFKKKEAILREKYTQLELELKQNYEDRLSEKCITFDKAIKKMKIDTLYKQNENVIYIIYLNSFQF